MTEKERYDEKFKHRFQCWDRNNSECSRIRSIINSHLDELDEELLDMDAKNQNDEQKRRSLIDRRIALLSALGQFDRLAVYRNKGVVCLDPFELDDIVEQNIEYYNLDFSVNEKRVIHGLARYYSEMEDYKLSSGVTDKQRLRCMEDIGKMSAWNIILSE